MFVLHPNWNKVTIKYYVTSKILKRTFRKLSTEPALDFKKNEKEKNNLRELVDKYEPKLFYNCFIERNILKLGYKKNKAYGEKINRHNKKLEFSRQCVEPIPLSLKYLSEDLLVKENVEDNTNELSNSEETDLKIQFPFNKNYSINNYNAEQKEDKKIEEIDKAHAINQEIKDRYKLTKDWMHAYDNYESDLLYIEDEDSENWRINYGTPDPKSKISKVPCGGCGALLHCKDSAIPGYIPSEIFKNHNKIGSAELSAIICQRCYFLKEYNIALQMQVSPDDYPKILTAIHRKRSLAVLMVDLLDFPCSIWPGISDILGHNTHVIVAGNKIDLIPKDSSNYLTRIKNNLSDQLKLSGFAMSKILDIRLISAKTGFGVEDLISSLHRRWRGKGDVYLIGCTNVGKSSLFNALLQSDYCKVVASDLIQRATTSQWPGTTLNLLKFPILRLSDKRNALRLQRIFDQKKVESMENHVRKEHLQNNNTSKYATLIGHIGRTFVDQKSKKDEDVKDYFSMQGHANASGKHKMGIDERHPNYALGYWCYDTPGVIQPDQILHLLTADELVETLPKKLIRPQTFCVRPQTSLFIAGLARLDYLEGPASVRLTVFRSNSLPLTICRLEEAENIYNECLGTELFKVPSGGDERLSKWPGLQHSKIITAAANEKNKRYSAIDIVLSSAGWVAVTCPSKQKFKFQAWTPEKRGIYKRDCLLPEAVVLRGARIRNSVAYKSNKFV